MNIQRFRHAFFHRWLADDYIRFFNFHAILFDLEGTAKSHNCAHVRAQRRRVHGSLAFGGSQVHWLVYYLLNFLFYYGGPLNERAHAFSHLFFFGPPPHLSPDRRGADFSKSMKSPLG
jgi:hypothetical protein